MPAPMAKAAQIGGSSRLYIIQNALKKRLRLGLQVGTELAISLGRPQHRQVLRELRSGLLDFRF